MDGKGAWRDNVFVERLWRDHQIGGGVPTGLRQRFDRTFGVIEPKREPRPGAEWSGLRGARSRRLLKDTDDDQGTEDHQSQGWLVGAWRRSATLEVY